MLETLEKKESYFKVLYENDLSLEEKIGTIAKEIYGADGVTYAPAAKKELKRITDMGLSNFPVCMAKHSILFPMTRQNLAVRRDLPLT